MKVDVINMQGKKVDTTELPAQIFEAPIKRDLMHQALVRQMANARLGTHKTKSRGEVRGGGRKPWRQKGTGRARQGSRRAPNWVGGGKVHTPRPRDYSLKMPRKMRRAALCSALSIKASQMEILVLDKFGLQAPETKEMAMILNTLVGSSSALILLAVSDENVEKSVNNLTSAKVLRANYLNVRDLLGYERVILPIEALEVIQSYLGA
ncbi:MAG: 50S ribosomal protein L4 [Anaerolineales bacterium]|nr:MAG: 50S ribosomal protein L4 [Anaerolineales bacterium]